MTTFATDRNGKLIIDGKYTFTGNTAATADVESIGAMTAAIETIEKNPESLTPEIKKAILGAKQEMEGLGANPKRLGVITEGMSYAPKEGTLAKTIMADLIDNPLRRKFLSVDELKGHGITDIPKLDEYIGAREEIAALIKRGGDNVVNIEKQLLKHHDAPDEVIQALAGTKVDGVKSNVSKIVKDLAAKVSGDANKVTTIAQDLQKAQLGVAQAKAANTLGDALKPFEEAVTKAETELKAAIKGSEHRAGAVLGRIKQRDAGLGKFLEAEKSIASEMQAVLKGAGEAAKTAWGWTNKLAPKAEGVTGALWKNRGVSGKAGVIAGAAAIVYGIVSAVGGKGPGENAERVNQGREGEPAVGRA